MTRKGFTLIELLVVIAVIAIIAAIVFPVFAKVRDRARQASDISNEKQLGLAITQYVQDNNDTYPMLAQWAPSSQGACFNLWDQTVEPYINSLSVFGSPEDSSSLRNVDLSGDLAGIFHGNIPVGTSAGVSISYAINAIAVDLTSGHPNHLRGLCGFQDAWFNPCNLPASCGTDIAAQHDSNIDKPDQTIMLSNCFARDSYSGWNSSLLTMSCGFLGGDSANPNPDTMGGGYGGAEVYPSGLETSDVAGAKAYIGDNSAPFSGGTKADYLFVDGHVASMAPLATNPDPVAKPAENLWVCNRPDNDSQPVNWSQ